MNGYEAAVKAKNEQVKVWHPALGAVLWVEGCGLCWENQESDQSRVPLDLLASPVWRMVENSDEPEPPEGCVLWPLDMTVDGDYEVKGCPLTRIEADARFRGWGYVTSGELHICAYSIAWTDGRCLIPAKPDTPNTLRRPDYAVMEEPDPERKAYEAILGNGRL